jgi:polyvinyl alcohol dehydrogenase (cytochrome)
MTGSPVIDHGVAYVGLSSGEEAVPGISFDFRGSVVALDLRTGRLIWRRYMVPPGYTGGAVWGSAPVVDHKTGLLYVATGNNYSVPPGVCVSAGQTACAPPAADDYFDAIVGLDLRSGAVRWAAKTISSDVTEGPGPDYDFGSSPNLYTTVIDGRPTDLLGIGQKSGIYWALDPANGRVVWKTQVGAGGEVGGIMWGSATDGRRVYVAISDYFHTPYTIISATGKLSTIDGGSWSALDAGTGRILWQTPDPQGAADIGFVSAADGVVYGGSAAPAGNTMYALDASDGRIAWAFASGSSVVSGAAIVDGIVYWGTGDYIPGTTAGDTLYAFSLYGRE